MGGIRITLGIGLGLGLGLGIRIRIRIRIAPVLTTVGADHITHQPHHTRKSGSVAVEHTPLVRVARYAAQNTVLKFGCGLSR